MKQILRCLLYYNRWSFHDFWSTLPTIKLNITKKFGELAKKWSEIQ